MNNSKKEVDSLPDGTYKGSFKPFNLIKLATVEFTIKERKIKRFEISRLFLTPWKEVRPSIQDSIKKNSSLKFNAVSGATRSSFYVKAAILNATDQPKNTLNPIEK